MPTITVSVTDYMFSNYMQKPRGFGWWAFWGIRNGEVVNQCMYVGNYGWAKSQAIKWAKENGCTSLKVAT